MLDSFVKYWLPPSDIPADDRSTTVGSSTETHIEVECKEFLPEVYDTWAFLHKLSTDSTRFREIYDLYKYERSESERRSYFDQLKALDDAIYKLSLGIHQRIQTLEKIVKPSIDEFRKSSLHDQQTNHYIPAYIRIAQNQLHSLEISFQRLIAQHNSDSLDYQNDLRQSLRSSSTIADSYQHISRATIDRIKSLFNTDGSDTNMAAKASQEQLQLQISDDRHHDLAEQEMQIADLEARLESVRTLKERVRQMNETTMALYFSVQEQNELADNIWLNTSAGSDYIAQSIDEVRLVKTLKQSKRNLWVKLISVTFCFLLVLILVLTLALLLSQK